MDSDKKHLLQKYGILQEFDIISHTTLDEFMNVYKTVVETSDDVRELARISKLLSVDTTNIPGYEDDVSLKKTDNPELNKVAYAIIEFMMKKTTDPSDWAYLLTYIINKLNLEIEDDSNDSN
jgi:hypothetical protein